MEHPRPIFYIGIDDVYYAHRFPYAFISINRLRNRKSDFQVNNWILDSGAFTEITTHGRYRSEPEEYVTQINRWMRCGIMEMAVTQDFMCEPFVLNITGLSVADHQRLTIERYKRIAAGAQVDVMAVLQGYAPGDYVQHIAQYGDLLKHGQRVGVGSVCKRNSDPAVIEYILKTIKHARPDLRLHGIGLKLTALQRPEICKLLHSCDSMAWSLNARKNGKDAHDWRTAEEYRQKVIAPTPFAFEWTT